MSPSELAYYMVEADRRNWTIKIDGANSTYRLPLGQTDFPVDALPYDLGYMALITHDGTVFLDEGDFVYVDVERRPNGSVEGYYVAALLFRGKTPVWYRVSPRLHQIVAATLRDTIRRKVKSGAGAYDIRNFGRVLWFAELWGTCRRGNENKEAVQS